MPLAVHVAGPALIRIGPEGCSNAQLQTLGYTRDGARIRTEAYWEEVHTDEWGGDAGPPAEIVYHGERAIVQLELTKWDATIADAIAKRVSSIEGHNTGIIPGAGLLVFSGGLAYRLVIDFQKEGVVDWEFPRAVPREPIEINKGSRPSIMVVTFDCYPKFIGAAWVLYTPFT
jgi:hypothetical protein